MKRLYIMFLALALAITMIAPVGVVTADSTSEVDGEVAVTAEEWVIQGYTGCCMIGQIKRTVTFDGSFNGEAVEELNYYLRCTNGQLEFVGEGLQSFTGTLMGGEEGTYTARVVNRWEYASSLVERCEQTIISSTGGLANLDGTIYREIRHDGNGVLEGTYSGQVTLAP
jgi:hypothetical protein